VEFVKVTEDPRLHHFVAPTSSRVANCVVSRGGGGRRRHAVALAYVPDNSWLKPNIWLDGAATASNTLYRQLPDSSICLNSWSFAEWTGGS